LVCLFSGLETDSKNQMQGSGGALRSPAQKLVSYNTVTNPSSPKCVQDTPFGVSFSASRTSSASCSVPLYIPGGIRYNPGKDVEGGTDMKRQIIPVLCICIASLLAACRTEDVPIVETTLPPAAVEVAAQTVPETTLHRRRSLSRPSRSILNFTSPVSVWRM